MLLRQVHSGTGPTVHSGTDALKRVHSGVGSAVHFLHVHGPEAHTAGGRDGRQGCRQGCDGDADDRLPEAGATFLHGVFI